MTMKQLKGSTVGDLLNRVGQPYCYDDPRRTKSRLRSSQVKIEQQDYKKDIFAMQFEQKSSMPLHKLYQVKQEPGVKSEHQAKKAVSAKTRKIFYMDDKSNKKMHLQVTFQQSNYRQPPKNLQAPHFDHNVIWDTERHLYKHNQSGQQAVTIPSLVELPEDKKKLNKPADYHPVGEPKKKKMYRPAVPKIFYLGYDVFLQRRKKSKPQKDLAVLSLDEIVQQCYNRQLIPLDIYTRFMNLNGTLHILKIFIQRWITNQIHLYDFNRTPFTLLDHRRLAQLLMHFYPNDYTIGAVEAFHVDEKQFLTRVYLLDYEEYIKCYMILDNISGCKWWTDIKNRYQNSEHYHYFQVNESLKYQIKEIENCQTKQTKSQSIAKIVGPLNLQDGQAELQKILSNKFKNSPREFNNEETTTEGQSRFDQFSGQTNDMQIDMSNYGNYGEQTEQQGRGVSSSNRHGYYQQEDD